MRSDQQSNTGCPHGQCPYPDACWAECGDRKDIEALIASLPAEDESDND